MSTLAAIETNYAGCRFRSRLEARWAVFFDHLEIPWNYEIQGYTVGPVATRYLPDFWLPTMKLWVEVKGALEQRDLETIIWAAGPAGLPTELGGDPPLTLFPWAERMLVLGDIPQPGTAWLHTRLDVLAYELVVANTVVFWPLKSGGIGAVEMLRPMALNPYVTGMEMEAGYRRSFVDGIPCPLPMDQHERITEAYRAARSARFEHGESPSIAARAEESTA